MHLSLLKSETGTAVETEDGVGGGDERIITTTAKINRNRKLIKSKRTLTSIIF